MSFTLCDDMVVQPSCVQNSASGHMMGKDRVNLVISKGNVLEVYNVLPEVNADDQLLELIHTEVLFGNIVSMAMVKLYSDDREALLLSFSEAKVSVLEWDPGMASFKTLSLHCYENKEWMKSGKSSHSSVPYLRVDPLGRCAIILTYDKYLAVIPFVSGLSVNRLFEGGEVIRNREKGIEADRSITSFVINMYSFGTFNIRDITFLYGSHDPSIMVLCEPEESWAGWIPIREKSMSIYIFSLGLSKQHAGLMWKTSGLPIDCHGLVSLPSDTPGGAIILSSNALIHVAPGSLYAIRTNIYGPATINDMAVDNYDVVLALEDSKGLFLNENHMLLSLQNGELYTCALMNNGRSVKRIEITPCVKGVPAMALTNVVVGQDKYIFIASIAGNSLLVKYEESIVSKVVEEEDEDELYSRIFKHGEAVETLSSFTFRAVDELVNTGPVQDMIVSPLSVQSKGVANDDLEIVSCAGKGAYGSIVVSQRCVYADVEEVEGMNTIQSVWTLYASEGGQEEEASYEEEDHKYMFVSRESGTTVLSMSTMEELFDTHNVCCSEQTLHVSNAAEDQRIIQVCTSTVMYLDSALKKVHSLTFGKAGLKGIKGEDIVQISSYEPYVALLTKEGEVVVIHCTAKKMEVVTPGEDEEGNSKRLLYANAISLYRGGCLTVDPEEVVCAISTKLGGLSLVSIPSYQVIFQARGFSNGRNVLHGEENASLDVYQIPSSRDIIELTIMAPEEHLCYMLALQRNGMLLLYRGYVAEKHNERAIYFGKLSMRYVPTKREFEATPSGKEGFRYRKLTRFRYVDGFDGIHIGTGLGHWLLFWRGYPRIYPAHRNHRDLRRIAMAFVEDEGISFVGCTTSGKLKKGKLAKMTALESTWVQKKVPVKGTPTHIAYEPSSNTILVALLQAEVLEGAEAQKFHDEYNDFEAGTKMRRRLHEFEPDIVRKSGKLQLFVPGSWVSVDEHDLQPNERILSMKSMMLRDMDDQTWHNYVVVGTGIQYSEDKEIFGRMLIFEVLYHAQRRYTEAKAQSSKDLKLSLKFQERVRGAVSTVDSLDGYLLVSRGPKIMAYTFNGSSIQGWSFYDSQLYNASVSVVRNIVFVGDYYKAPVLLRWMEKGHALKKLSTVGDDRRVVSTGFLIDGSDLSMIFSDMDGSIQYYVHSPAHPESRGGQILVSRGDFMLVGSATKFIRLPVGKLKKASDGKSITSGTFANWFGTKKGSMGYISPVGEEIFRRLGLLIMIMVPVISFTAGCNPQAFRHYVPKAAAQRTSKLTTLDSVMLWRYVNLDYRTQEALAKQVKSSVDELMGDIISSASKLYGRL